MTIDALMSVIAYFPHHGCAGQKDIERGYACREWLAQDWTEYWHE